MISPVFGPWEPTIFNRQLLQRGCTQCLTFLKLAGRHQLSSPPPGYHPKRRNQETVPMRSTRYARVLQSTLFAVAAAALTLGPRPPARATGPGSEVQTVPAWPRASPCRPGSMRAPGLAYRGTQRSLFARLLRRPDLPDRSRRRGSRDAVSLKGRRSRALAAEGARLARKNSTQGTILQPAAP